MGEPTTFHSFDTLFQSATLEPPVCARTVSGVEMHIGKAEGIAIEDEYRLIAALGAGVSGKQQLHGNELALRRGVLLTILQRILTVRGTRGRPVGPAKDHGAVALHVVVDLIVKQDCIAASFQSEWADVELRILGAVELIFGLREQRRRVENC